jgi:hypothetical protein
VQLLDAPVAAPEQTRPRSAVRWVLIPVAFLSAWAALAIAAAIPIVVNMINTPQQEHTLDAALRIGAVTWAALLATPFDAGPVHVTLLPWGFTLVALGIFWTAGRAVVLATGRRWLLSSACLLGGAMLTGIGSVLIGRFAELGDVLFRPWQVGAFGFAIATIGFGIALLTTLRDQQPMLVRSVLRGAMVAVFALIAIGSLLVLISFLRNLTMAQELLDTVQPTAGTGFLLTGLQVGYLPVLIIWAVSYLTGTGFFLGSVVSPFIAAGEPIDVPPLPILAAIPTSASPAAWLFPVSIVLVGALAGHAALRTLTGPRWWGFVAVAGMAGVAGFIVTMLAVMSSGALGIDRLAAIGPTPNVVGAIIAGLILVGALPRAVFWARA